MNRADTEYRKDIIHRTEVLRMAREAGGYLAELPMMDAWLFAEYEYLERFVALVASAEREKHKWDIHSCSPTCNRYACVATREAVLAERERLAKVCDDLWEDDGTAYDCAEAIRTLGQA